jgi:rhomboid protease GluP
VICVFLERFTLSMIVPAIVLLFNVLIYVLPEIVDFGKRGEGSREAFNALFIKENEAIREGEFYRLFTAMFLHADVFHLLANSYAIFIFSLSPVFQASAVLYLATYLLGGVVGNIFSFFFNPNPSLGASGSVFGLIGVLVVMILQGGEPTRILTIGAYIFISFLFAMTPGSRIDNWGHLGGLVAGVTMGLLLFM